MKKILACLLALAMLCNSGELIFAKENSSIVNNSASSYNISNLSNAPDVVAESALVMDAGTGAILYGKNANTKRYPASITKVMTALLAIENCNMNDIITYSNSAVNGIEAGSSTAGINVGAKLTVEDSLYALMLVSANEAAAAIAEHVSGSVDAFAKLMTTRAKELGCTGTNFKNPHGLPDEEHYTTAHDMGLIVKEALKHEEFCKISGTISYTLKKSKTLDSTLELWNHAKILRKSSDYYYECAKGAKTGFTHAALNTLVTYAQKGNTKLICVILKDYGADNSYKDTKRLFQWAFSQVKQITPLSQFDFNDALSSNKKLKEKQKDQIRLLNCTFDKNYPILVPKDFDASSLTTAFSIDEDKKAGRIGYITISCNNQVIGKTPVVYDTSTKQGKAYQEGNSVSDNLKTVHVTSKKEQKLRKGLEYCVRIIVAILLVVTIMNLIRRRELERRRQERIANRHHSSPSDDEESQE